MEKAQTPDNLDGLATCYFYTGALTNDQQMLNNAYEIYANLVRSCPGVAKYAGNAEAVRQQLKALKPHGIFTRIKDAFNRRKKDKNG